MELPIRNGPSKGPSMISPSLGEPGRFYQRALESDKTDSLFSGHLGAWGWIDTALIPWKPRAPSHLFWDYSGDYSIYGDYFEWNPFYFDVNR